MKIIKAIGYGVIFLLTGCGSLMRTEYQRPQLDLPDQWQQNVRIISSQKPLNSQTQLLNFHDPALMKLITLVLESNNDLALAGIKLKLARASAGLTNTNLTPDFSFTGSASNTKSIKHGSRPQENYSSGLSLNYELDLWGKLARIREKDEWEAVASEYDYQATRLTLINTTSQLYWRIALLNWQIDNQIAGKVIAEKILAQTESWYHAGKVGQLDVLHAKQTVINRQNELEQLINQQQNTKNSLTLLLNSTVLPESIDIKPINLRQNVLVEYSAPLSVISTRPDVRAIESRLRSMLANSDVARLSFYPTLSLQAALNAGSQLFSQWFSDPTRVVGSAVSLPFIQWNTVRLTIEQSDLQVQQTAIEFRNSAYNAIMEVNNAINARTMAETQKSQLFEALSLGQQRLALTTNRYQAGAVNYQTLLTAQDDLLSIENSLAQNQYDYLYATLQLWLAQGGEN
ncbi:TolC family protein [Providencia rettgeri]|nr:TolC family protein [Providencia rettgeri]